MTNSNRRARIRFDLPDDSVLAFQGVNKLILTSEIDFDRLRTTGSWLGGLFALNYQDGEVCINESSEDVGAEGTSGLYAIPIVRYQLTMCSLTGLTPRRATFLIEVAISKQISSPSSSR